MTDYFQGDARSNYERMLAGDRYLADDPRIVAEQQHATQSLAKFAAAFVQDAFAAQELVRELLGSFGEDAHIRPPFYVDYGSRIHIGARSFINFNCVALDVAEIRIGEDCLLGPNVQLLTPTHPLEAAPRRDKLEAAQPITLGNNVWLGGGVIVCPGVSIGDNTVVGAGSVVTKDLPPNVVAVGNPARVIRELPD